MAPPSTHILVIDDEVDSRTFIREYLEWHGYRIDEAEDAEKGLTMASLSPPDLVLMDMRLPGMDGMAATRALRMLSGFEQVPVLALTGHSGKAYESACLEAGCRAVLVKPLEPDELLARVRQLTARGEELTLRMGLETGRQKGPLVGDGN